MWMVILTVTDAHKRFWDWKGDCMNWRIVEESKNYPHHSMGKAGLNTEKCLGYGEKAWRQLHKNDSSNIERVLEATPHTVAVRPLTIHHENYLS